jgi:hypothetical protein
VPVAATAAPATHAADSADARNGDDDDDHDGDDDDDDEDEDDDDFENDPLANMMQLCCVATSLATFVSQNVPFQGITAFGGVGILTVPL